MGHLTKSRTRLIGLGFGLVLLGGCGAAEEPGRLLIVEQAPFDVASATGGRLQSLSALVRVTLTACAADNVSNLRAAHGIAADAATRVTPHWLVFDATSTHVVSAIDAPPVRYCQAFVESGPFFGAPSIRYTDGSSRTSTLAFDRLVDFDDPYTPTPWLPKTTATQHQLVLSVDADAFSAVFRPRVQADELDFEVARALSSSLRVEIRNAAD